MTPEGRVKQSILRYLKRRGFYAWNNPSGAVRIAQDRWVSFGKKGSADILGCLPGGKFLAVETKAPAGRLSLEQREFLEKIRSLGGVAIVVRSAWELDEALREAGYADGMELFNA
ncbi:MAG: VRR-NUC domain-containing protein [Treponema sp.]|jgi:hypothetical protein|nr:VRR-NUC domain-containing protein [Treponema sp.]